MAEDAAAALRHVRVERHAPEVAAVDVRDAVVPGEPLVDERVVGSEQIEDAAVVANEALDEELGLPQERLAQVLVELRKHQRVRHDAAQIAQVEPLAREVADELRRARIRQHPPRLRFEHRRVGEPALIGQVEQRVVRPARPEEVRQAGRHLEIGQRVGRGRLDVDRIALDPEEEVGRDEHAFQRKLDAGVEAAVAAAGPVEVHEGREVRRVDRPAIGAARQRRQDLRGAGVLVLRRRAVRPAGEDGAAARGVARTRAHVRPADRPRARPPRSRRASR